MRETFKEGYFEYREVRCAGCDVTVDLSSATSLDEAIDVWNDHVEANHGGNQ